VREGNPWLLNDRSAAYSPTTTVLEEELMATNAMAFINVQNSNVHGQRNQRPLMPPVDDKIVTVNLIDYFETVITGVSLCPSSLVRDCAVICAFLQSKKLFNEFYERVVDPELKAARDLNKKRGYDSQRGGALMHAFYELMQNHGFKTIKGIVLMGNAPGFQKIVGSGLLFKDCTGPLHGEFTHSLQWLTICKLAECKGKNLIQGGYEFTNSISKIYKEVVTIKIVTWPSVGATEVTWPGEINFGNFKSKDPEEKTLWDLMVDGFASHKYDGKKLADEDAASNLYTGSYRCPSNLLVAVQMGDLQGTFIGLWWKNRMVKYQDRVDKGEGAAKPNPNAKPNLNQNPKSALQAEGPQHWYSNARYHRLVEGRLAAKNRSWVGENQYEFVAKVNTSSSKEEVLLTSSNTSPGSTMEDEY
jgi:hypothetical protein